MKNMSISATLLLIAANIVSCSSGENKPDGGADAANCDGGVPVGESRDLIPYARLRASDTRTSGAFPWVREAEDSMATVRDTDVLTSWKAPLGKKSTVTIDFMPWTRRAILLNSVYLSFSTKPPLSTSVRLLNACGGTAIKTLDWTEPKSMLDLGGTMAGCVEIDFTTGAESFDLEGINLYSMEADLVFPHPPAAAAQAAGLHPNSGVVEGFYGVPWSWREREHIVALVGAIGMDSYLYAPKFDPLHRAKWRDPYPSDFTGEMAALSGVAFTRGVTVYLGISPFIDYNFDTDDDYHTLLSKLGTFVDRGVRGIGLLADDIEMEIPVTIDGALGTRHAAVANRLLKDLQARSSDVKMWFVGTVYRDNQAADKDGVEYLKALANLNPEIKIMWTGTGIFCPEMKGSDMDFFRATVGRRPLIWDNYWANDAGDGASGRILLGVLGGRGPDLIPSVEGIAHNLMIQGSLSRLDLAMFGWYMDNPASKEEAKFRDHAAALEQLFNYPKNPLAEGACPPPAAFADTGIEQKALMDAMRVFDGSAVSIPSYMDMEKAVMALKVALAETGGPAVAQASALMDIFAGMVAMRSDAWHSRLDADLVDELEFPMLKAYYDGLAGLWTLSMLGEKLRGDTGKYQSSMAYKWLTDSNNCRFVYSGSTISDFYDDMSSFKPVQKGFSAPVGTGQPPECVVGKAFSWNPFNDAKSAAAYGLSGAVTDGANITWNPPHPGTYEGVVTAKSAAGWAFQQFKITCE